MATDQHHRVVIVGGGAAGITVAARLGRAHVDDVAIIEPSDKHFYHPYWTLVGGGIVKAEKSRRTEASVMPKNATWIKDAAESFDPENNTVGTAGGKTIGYDVLVVCPGIQLDFDRTPGLPETLGNNNVSTNYEYDMAPRTWEFIRGMTKGTAVFTMPGGPIKCAGAPQKIAYLASDYWREQGVLKDIDVHLVLPTPGMFGVKEFSDVLDQVVARYGINVHFNSEMTSIDGDARKLVITDHANDDSTTELDFDMVHATPHQSAPDWIKSSPLSTGDANGYVDVDKFTHQHVRYPNIFSLGDAGSTPNSKTGAAVRKQAPVVTENVKAVLASQTPGAKYKGYASCPLTTSRHKMLLAEFDYSGQAAPSIPLINTKKERRDMWYLKKYGLPFLYWNFMLKGRA